MADTAGFYGAAAGALPLLYIALAVEERSGSALGDLVEIFVDDEAKRPIVLAVTRGAYLAVVSGILISGIAAAFVGLAHPEWSLNFGVGYTASIVTGALGFGGVLIVLLPCVGAALSVLRQTGASKSASASVLAAAGAVALVAVYLAVVVVLGLLH